MAFHEVYFTQQHGWCIVGNEVGLKSVGHMWFYNFLLTGKMLHLYDICMACALNVCWCQNTLKISFGTKNITLFGSNAKYYIFVFNWHSALCWTLFWNIFQREKLGIRPRKSSTPWRLDMAKFNPETPEAKLNHLELNITERRPHIYDHCKLPDVWVKPAKCALIEKYTPCYFIINWLMYFAYRKNNMSVMVEFESGGVANSHCCFKHHVALNIGPCIVILYKNFAGGFQYAYGEYDCAVDYRGYDHAYHDKTTVSTSTRIWDE